MTKLELKGFPSREEVSERKRVAEPALCSVLMPSGGVFLGPTEHAWSGDHPRSAGRQPTQKDRGQGAGACQQGCSRHLGDIDSTGGHSDAKRQDLYEVHTHGG